MWALTFVAQNHFCSYFSPFVQQFVFQSSSALRPDQSFQRFSLVEPQQHSHPIIVISIAEKLVALVCVCVCVCIFNVCMVRDAAWLTGWRQQRKRQDVFLRMKSWQCEDRSSMRTRRQTGKAWRKKKRGSQPQPTMSTCKKDTGGHETSPALVELGWFYLSSVMQTSVVSRLQTDTCRFQATGLRCMFMTPPLEAPRMLVLGLWGLWSRISSSAWSGHE